MFCVWGGDEEEMLKYCLKYFRVVFVTEPKKNVFKAFKTLIC